MEEVWHRSEGIYLDMADRVAADNECSKSVKWPGNPIRGLQDSESIVAQVQQCGIAWEIRGHYGQIAPAAGNHITGTKAAGWASGQRGTDAKAQEEQKGCSSRFPLAATNKSLAEKL